jgi:hypothetical protein
MDQVAPVPSEAVFVVPEEQLATALGLSREDLRGARRSTQRGTDWEVRGHRVCWSEKAAGDLALRQQPQNGVAHHPNAPEPVATPPLAPTTPSEPFLPPLEVLRVTGWNFPNARVLRCVSENNGHAGESITVRVKDARLFRNGMRVLARPQPGSAWQFAGNPAKPDSGVRYPRYPGVW